MSQKFFAYTCGALILAAALTPPAILLYDTLMKGLA